jgi:Xaa-Pro aminopeptidase
LTDSLSRLEKLLNQQNAHQLDGMLLTHPPNLQYLFGFTGSTGWAYVSDREVYLLVDSRYIEQAEKGGRDCSPILVEQTHQETLRKLLAGNARHPRVGFESRHLSYSQASSLQEGELKGDFIPTEGLVEGLRVVKEDVEIVSISNGFLRANAAFTAFLDEFTPGESELEACGRLEHCCRRAGAASQAFETILLSGPRTSLPHGMPGNRAIQSNDPVLIDFGIRFEGYCTDMTRSLVEKTGEAARIHSIVQEAQASAMDSIRPGVKCQAVDAAARKIIEQCGYGPQFGHGTGHGLGIEVHEDPRVSPRGDSILEEGMVITIEPGIYLPGKFGVRIEDVVVVTDDGYRLLSES